MVFIEKPDGDVRYIACCEDMEDYYEPDEQLLNGCVDCDMKMVRQALADGADINLQNHPWGNTPMHLVSCAPEWDAQTIQKEKADRLEIAKFLVKMGADMNITNTYGFKPMDIARVYRYLDTVDFLESKGAQHGWFGAAIANDVPALLKYLENGQDIDEVGRFGRTAHAEAKMAGSLAAEHFLIENGCDRRMPNEPDGRNLGWIRFD
jgi:ankyrin repeat protein